MATTRTRTPRPEPPEAEPLTDDQILAEFRRHAAKALAAFEETKDLFLEKCSEDASEALIWCGSPLVTLQAEAQMWARATRFIESNQCPLSTLGLASELRDYAQEEMDGIIRSRRWEHNSTCAMSNLVRLERLSGEADAWRAIREFGRWAIREIEKRPVPPAGPAGEGGAT